MIDISEPVGGSPNEDFSVADKEGCTEGFNAFFPFGFEGTFFLEAATAAAMLVFILIILFDNLEKHFHVERFEQCTVGLSGVGMWE